MPFIAKFIYYSLTFGGTIVSSSCLLAANRVSILVLAMEGLLPTDEVVGFTIVDVIAVVVVTVVRLARA